MKNWITSDCHFGHSNIIKYCNRPFKNVKENDDTILNNINSLVSNPNDHLYILGDFCFGDPYHYIQKINCKNLHFVIGSHDKKMWRCKQYFIEFKDKIITTLNNHIFVMTHCCHLTWEKSHWGSIHLYGHSHGRLGRVDDPEVPENKYRTAINLILSRAKSMDVGVDTNNFKPYSIEEIIELMSKKEGFIIKNKIEEKKDENEEREIDSAR